MALALQSAFKIFIEVIMPIARTISHNGTHTKSFEGSRSMLDGSEFDLRSGRMGKTTKPSSRLPGWVPWAVGGIAIGAICYGLLQTDFVRDLLSRATEPIKDFFSGDEFEESGYVPRAYEDESDFGSGDFGSSASERLRSQL